MMYTLLVKVFGANQRKWFVLYVFLGWGKFVIASLTVTHTNIQTWVQSWDCYCLMQLMTRDVA